MAYDPAFPRAHYDRVADDEWTRLTRSRRGELNFLVHMDVLRRHIATDMDVLEIGAGSGVYTKELVHMARRLVVSDLSEVQLSLNRDHMRDLGVLDLVDDYRCSGAKLKTQGVSGSTDTRTALISGAPYTCNLVMLAYCGGALSPAETINGRSISNVWKSPWTTRTGRPNAAPRSRIAKAIQ